MVNRERIARVYRILCIVRKKFKVRMSLEPEEHYLYLEFAMAVIFDGVNNPDKLKSKHIMAVIFAASFFSKVHAFGEISEKALDRKIQMQKIALYRRDVMVYVGRGKSRGSFCLSQGRWRSHAPYKVVGIVPKHLQRNRRIMY